MADQQINEGAYRISGRYGEGFYIDPTGVRPPLKIMEATEISFVKSLAVIDVQLAGNRTGTKDGSEAAGTGNLVVQKIDNFWNNLVFDALDQNLDARRAARDAGHRITRTFTLQVWEDDPEALGAIGHQLEGVRISDYQGGFNFADDVTSQQHAFRFERFRKIKAFERIGNQIDPTTGLPSIRFTDDLNIASGS